MLRLRCFGGLSLARDGVALTGLAAQPRRLALLALLARAGDRGLRRERLVALLWPEADDERGRRSLAQAVYAIRRELDDDDVFVGTHDLRLDPARLASDVAERDAALADGDLARAAALYAGPFLDGVSLPGLPELDRWAEDQRTALAHDHATVLERLATRADAAGHRAEAVGWWRQLAAVDPLNGRVAVALMTALVAANDRGGALRHATIFETLHAQELDAPPDGDVAAFVARLRAGAIAAPPAPAPPAPGIAAPVAPPVALAAPAPIETPAEAEPVVALPTADASPRRWRSGRLVAVGVAAGALLATAVGALRAKRPDAQGAVVAVGRVAGHGEGAALAAPVADLLATNLARSRDVQVVSAARIQDLLRGSRDSSDGAMLAAARAAGATEVVEGTLYALGAGRLRLDLRRVDVASGRVRDARTVEGADLFALVDSGTARLVGLLGAGVPEGSIADVTTRSVAAYQLYVAGLRRFYANDRAGAERLFGDALREDPRFALAAYYHARSTTSNWHVANERWRRAVELSANASDRERLLIRGGWAEASSSPALAAIADSLVARYPGEVEGHLFAGIALGQSGDHAGAVRALRRVVAMDSVGIVGGRPGCAGCEAIGRIVGAYLEADSAARAVEEARRWTRWQPRSVPAWHALHFALDIAGRDAEAADARRAASAVDSTLARARMLRALAWMRRAEHARADSVWRAMLASGVDEDAETARWYLTTSLRDQGRLREALEMARRYRASRDESRSDAPGAAPASAQLEAQVRFELGEHRAAAALFDSIARWRVPNSSPSAQARHRAWNATHAAEALAAAGDTAAVAARAERVRADGALSAFPRDRLLHHHLRGLLHAARGDHAAAADAFRASIWSPTFGYTRANLMLARSLLRVGRARDAVAALQPALRGALDASNMYVTRTELREALAAAWAAAGNVDSAAAHHRVVAASWARADAPLRARGAAAPARLTARGERR